MSLLKESGKSAANTDSAAVIYKSKVFSYGELLTRVYSQAAYLNSKGIKKNDFAALITGHNPDFIINVFALWKLGAVPVPINTRLTGKEMDELIDFAGCRFVISETIYSSELPCIPSSINELYDGSGIKDFNPAPGDLALIMFTSGSTGKPKGVQLTFGNLISSAEKAKAYLRQSSQDRWLASLPFYHIGGFSIIIRAFLSGSSVIIPDSVSADDIAECIVNDNPTLTSFVSTQLVRLLEIKVSPNPQLHNVLLGGGFISDELVQSALSHGWIISKVYGSTETSSLVTAINCSSNEKVRSAGMPLPGNEIFITDKNGTILPANTSGEIVIKGDSVSPGYVNNNEESSKKFLNGCYHSGDTGYLDEEGYLFIESRRTDLIISGGENINPFEVESAIIKHPFVAEAAVFSSEDDEWGQIAAAAIKLKPGHKIELNELKGFLESFLAGYKIPKRIIIVNDIPKTVLGKIKRDELKKLL